jgi:hypothetical protein
VWVCVYVCVRVCVVYTHTHTHIHTQEWCYGPVICRKMFLDSASGSGGVGVDVSLDVHDYDNNGQDPAKRRDQTTAKSVLDVIVENRRLNPKP